MTTALTPVDLAALRRDIAGRREELEKRRANLDEVERLLAELYPAEWKASLRLGRSKTVPVLRRRVPKKTPTPSRPKQAPLSGKAAPTKALPPPASVPAVIPKGANALATRVRELALARSGPFFTGEIARQVGGDTGRVGDMLKTLVRQGLLEMEVRLGRTGNVYWAKGTKPAEAPHAAPPAAANPLDGPAPSRTQRETVLAAALAAKGTFTTAELAVLTRLDRKTVSAVASVLCREAYLALIRTRPDGNNIYEITTVGRRAVANA